MQSQLKISIQGFKGSFHDAVAHELFGDDYHALERDTFPEVFADVKSGNADFGLFVIENSIAGAILENHDRLRDSGMYVVNEYYMPIKHQLIVVPGTKLEDIKEVWSHPMALKQCQKLLGKMKGVHQVEVSDTAGAVRDIIKDDLTHVAAIASERAAQVYGGEILKTNIEDDPQNYTRFLILAPEKPLMFKAAPRKTLLYIETKHESGALLNSLQVIHTFKYNMTLLVSRPIVGKPWQYGFYIDMVHDEEDLSDFYAVLAKHVIKFQELGSFAVKSA